MATQRVALGKNTAVDVGTAAGLSGGDQRRIQFRGATQFRYVEQPTAPNPATDDGKAVYYSRRQFETVVVPTGADKIWVWSNGAGGFLVLNEIATE